MKLTDSNTLKVGSTGCSAVVSVNSTNRYFHCLTGPFGLQNTVAATPIMWFDANQSSTLFTDTAGTTLASLGQTIARWNSRVGNYNFQQATLASRPIWTANVTQGKPLLNFGTITSNIFMNLFLSGTGARYDAGNSTHTIFCVVKGSNFILSDTVTYDYHRSGPPFSNTSPIWNSSFSDLSIRNGSTYLNKVLVNGTLIGLTGGYDVVSIATTGTGNARFNTLASDRGLGGRVGGMEYAEILIYSGTLNTADRSIVENYLYEKWVGTVPFILSTPLSGSATLQKTGAGGLYLIAANTYTGATSIISGNLDVSGSGLINSTSSIVNNGSLSFTKVTDAITLPTITGTGNISISSLSLTLTSSGNISGSVIAITTSAQLGGKGILVPATTARTITGTSINISGQVGQTTGSTSSLTMDTSAASGPIVIGFQNGESGWWFGLQTITANAGTGTITISGSRPSAESWGATNATNLTGQITISTSATFTLQGNLNFTATGNSSISSAITLGTGKAFAFAANAGVTITVSAILGGASVTLTKSGSGTLGLGSSAHTYTGATSILAGTLTASKTSGSSTGTATFTNTTLSVSFNVAPTAGMTFRYFPGTTTQTYASVTLVGAPGRTGTYNSATSTLTIA